MSDENDIMNRIAQANEQAAQVQVQKLQADMVNSQVSLERSFRQAALAAAVSLSGVHKYEDRDQVIKAAEHFLGWIREGRK